MTRTGLLQLLVAILLFGAAWPVTRFAAPDIPPLWFAAGRALLAAAATAGVLAVLGRLKLPPRTELRTVLVVGLLQLGAFFALAHGGLMFVPSGRTALVSNTTTIFVAPLAVLVLRERVGVPRWMGAGLGLLGIAVLAGPWSLDWSAPGMVLGHALLLAAAASWAAAMITLRARPPRAPMLELLPWAFLLALAVLLPTALLLSAPPVAEPRAAALVALLVVGAIAGPVGTWCVIAASVALPAMVSATGFLAIPVLGLALGTLWLGEPFGWDLLLGGALVLAGAAVAARR